MKRVVFITAMCAFMAVPAMADMISFVDSHPLAGVDGTQLKYGGTVNWSTNDSLVNLNHSYSLLGGTATVAAFTNGSIDTLSHRLTRGLGVWGNEDDEVDRGSVSNIEHIDITFDSPVAVTYIEVRSLYWVDTTGTNSEWASIQLWNGATLVQTDYLKGMMAIGSGGNGLASITHSPIWVDKLVFRVPTKAELQTAGYSDTQIGDFVITESEFAVAKIDVVPVPGAVLLGMLGLSVAGVKLRKFA